MNSHLDHAYRLGQQLAEFEKQADLLDAMARVGKFVDKSKINRMAASAELGRRLGATSGTLTGLGLALQNAVNTPSMGAAEAALRTLGSVATGNIGGRMLGTAGGAIAALPSQVPGMHAVEKLLSKRIIR
tara:strand:- start:2628 stop:3017 length:390 start_codon:yes stop_codon:yes gene_type:complete